ncbi:hypothetical protein [Neoroseomonas lacus]|uniref:hypothetical protein n=1 Tax=Neoroseomonas lacus TaxID=287609 RepID=UPI00166DD736|nr:hypothetical protein [Neoroseomonas lacus]
MNGILGGPSGGSERANVYQPKVAVMRLRTMEWHKGSSKRYAAPECEIDLTPLICESGGTCTRKTLCEPVSGCSISCSSQHESEVLDTGAEPMSAIEIHAARGIGRRVGPISYTWKPTAARMLKLRRADPTRRFV